MKELPSLLPLLFLAACATPTPTLEARFGSADVNGDGVVSRNEATDLMIAEVFEMFDANRDGYVDEAEFIASGGTAQNFREVDRSNNGRLTLAEAQSSPAAIEKMAVPFDEADIDGNGAITYEEVEAYRVRLHAAVR